MAIVGPALARKRSGSFNTREKIVGTPFMTRSTPSSLSVDRVDMIDMTVGTLVPSGTSGMHVHSKQILCHVPGCENPTENHFHTCRECGESPSRHRSQNCPKLRIGCKLEIVLQDVCEGASTRVEAMPKDEIGDVDPICGYCGMIHCAPVKIENACFIIFNSLTRKVLITRQGSGTWKGKWGLPGGGVELLDKNPWSTAKREALEELGPEIEPALKRGASWFFDLPGKSSWNKEDVTTRFYGVDVANIKLAKFSGIRDGAELDMCKWIYPRQDVPDPRGGMIRAWREVRRIMRPHQGE